MVPPVVRRSGRAPRRGAAVLVWLTVALAAPRAGLGQPMAPPLVGGLSFTGPAVGDVTAIYYNPAALGLTHGTNLLFEFHGAFDRTDIARTPIDPQNGAPVSPGTPGARSFPEVHERVFAPTGFIGAASEFGSDSVTLGVGAYTPFYELRTPGEPQATPAQDGPTRYHLVDLTLYHLYITPAVAVRLADWVYLGAGFDFVYSQLGTLTVDRDTALDGTLCNVAQHGIENDACAERVQVNGSVLSVSIPVGIVLRSSERLTIGISYRSAAFTIDRDNVPLIGGGTLTFPGQTNGDNMFARTTMHLPQTVLAGAQLILSPAWELGFTARWLIWPEGEAVDVRLASTAAAERNVPDRTPLYRGYRDTLTLKVLGAYTPRPWLRLGLGGILSTPSVEVRAVSPAVVDGWQIWGLALAEARLGAALTLTAGYSLRVMVPRTVDASLFDPLYQVDCVQSRFDIPTCRLANSGRGVATSAGTYSSISHVFGITTALHF